MRTNINLRSHILLRAEPYGPKSDLNFDPDPNRVHVHISVDCHRVRAIPDRALLYRLAIPT